MKIPCFLAAFSSFPLLAMSLSPSTTTELVQKALEGQKMSYAPYSHYHVGSAVLTNSGKLYQGCNVENASYGLAICAERTAIFKAVSEGEQEFEAIVVITRDGKGMPCGACRQVLNEFNPNMAVITANEQGEIIHTLTLDQLLPHAFGPANLK